MFLESENEIEGLVKPKCGRMIIQKLGRESSSTFNGNKCFLEIDLTLKRRSIHREIQNAISMFNSVRKMENLEDKENFLKIIEEDHLEVFKREDDLNGTDRFALDDVLDEETCKLLIDLASVCIFSYLVSVHLYKNSYEVNKKINRFSLLEILDWFSSR